MRGSAQIYDARMAQFVLKIEQLSHIGARGSQDLRSPSPIMTPDEMYLKPKMQSTLTLIDLCMRLAQTLEESKGFSEKDKQTNKKQKTKQKT